VVGDSELGAVALAVVIGVEEDDDELAQAGTAKSNAIARQTKRKPTM
jgi:hypothetical protein